MMRSGLALGDLIRNATQIVIAKGILIPILFPNCRLPDPVIPAKAGIQALPASIMFNSFGNF